MWEHVRGVDCGARLWWGHGGQAAVLGEEQEHLTAGLPGRVPCAWQVFQNVGTDVGQWKG